MQAPYDQAAIACLNSAPSPALPFALVGLLYCGLNTSEAGTYSITFSYSYSAGA